MPAEPQALHLFPHRLLAPPPPSSPSLGEHLPSLRPIKNTSLYIGPYFCSDRQVSFIVAIVSPLVVEPKNGFVRQRLRADPRRWSSPRLQQRHLNIHISEME